MNKILFTDRRTDRGTARRRTKGNRTSSTGLRPVELKHIKDVILYFLPRWTEMSRKYLEMDKCIFRGGGARQHL